MQDKILMTDEYKKAEFISQEIPMSHTMCNYLLALCDGYKTPEGIIKDLALRLYNEQLNDFTYYCRTH